MDKEEDKIKKNIIVIVCDDDGFYLLYFGQLKIWCNHIYDSK